MDLILFIPLVVSFLISLFFVPYWIKKAKQTGLIWKDMNKLNRQPVAGSGGIIVVLAFIVGVFIFVAYRTFYLDTDIYAVEIFATISSVLLLAGIGLVDDLLGWRSGGLTIRSRIILIILASVPLIVINAGRSEISLPLVGAISLGQIYPLILIPLGIVGATTTFNILAGFNGLEAGQGIILLSALSLVAFLTGNSWLAIVALCMIAALLGFMAYNFYPARVFPGDSLTYAVGGLIAIMAILGNFEKLAVAFYIPYIIEAVLKSRGRLVKYSFGKPNENGALDLRYDQIYSLNHAGIYLLKKMGLPAMEKNVVYLIWAFQIVVIALAFLLFGRSVLP